MLLGKFSYRKFALIITILLTTLLTLSSIASVNADDNEGTGLEQLPTNIPNPPDLDKTDLSRKAIIVDLKKVPKTTPEVKLISSYPNSRTVLWVPLREAHLTFDKPVRPVDVKLEILNNQKDATQPNVVRASVDPDLKTVRFSVSGVKSGTWIMKWTAGKSTGTVDFKMTVTPKALGGQNHRHDSLGITNADKVGRIALATIPFTFFLIIRKRKKFNRFLALASTLLTSSLAFYTAYLALDFASTKDFFISLSSASPWSWFSIGIVSALMALEVERTKILLGLTIFLSLIIATTPHDQTLSRFLLTALVYLVLSLNIFASLYLLTQEKINYKYRLALKVGFWLTISFFAVLNIYSANGFSTARGDYLDMRNSVMTYSLFALVSYLLMDRELYSNIKTNITSLGREAKYVTYKELNKDEIAKEKKALTDFLDKSDVFIEVFTKNLVIYLKTHALYHIGLAILIILSLLVTSTLLLTLGQLIQFAPTTAGL